MSTLQVTQLEKAVKQLKSDLDEAHSIIGRYEAAQFKLELLAKGMIITIENLNTEVTGYKKENTDLHKSINSLRIARDLDNARRDNNE